MGTPASTLQPITQNSTTIFSDAEYDARMERYAAARNEFLGAYQAVAAFREGRNFYFERRHPGDLTLRAGYTAEGADLVANFWAKKPAYHAAKRDFRAVDASPRLGFPISARFHRAYKIAHTQDGQESAAPPEAASPGI